MNSTYNEIWMTIPNFSKYEISNLGNVKSVDRIVLSKNQSTEFRFNRRSKYIKPFYIMMDIFELHYITIKIKEKLGYYIG